MNKEMICKNCKYHYIEEISFDYPQSCCSKRKAVIEACFNCNEFEYSEDYINNLKEQINKQKEVISDYKEDISNLLDIIGKNCNELKCTSDEWLVIPKYQDKEVSE